MQTLNTHFYKGITCAFHARLLISLLAIILTINNVFADIYRLNPGDQIQLAVWGEDDLQQDVLVLPDGTITFPLIGVLHVSGKSIQEVQKLVVQRLQPFIPDATVNIAVTATAGNRVYLIGKVNNPGAYPLIRPTDVLQAISLAGGLARFAKSENIRIFRRSNGNQIALPFNYDEVIQGKSLKQNILLKSGDTIVVP